MEQFEFMMQYDWFRYTIMIIVTSRMVFKPLFTIAAKYVELSVELEDDKKLAKVMDSKWYKMAVFLVDLIGSAKMPVRKNKSCDKCDK